MEVPEAPQGFVNSDGVPGMPPIQLSGLHQEQMRQEQPASRAMGASLQSLSAVEAMQILPTNQPVRQQTARILISLRPSDLAMQTSQISL